MVMPEDITKPGVARLIPPAKKRDIYTPGQNGYYASSTSDGCRIAVCLGPLDSKSKTPLHGRGLRTLGSGKEVLPFLISRIVAKQYLLMLFVFFLILLRKRRAKLKIEIEL
jgi:hypothetical protein